MSVRLAATRGSGPRSGDIGRWRAAALVVAAGSLAGCWTSCDGGAGPGEPCGDGVPCRNGLACDACTSTCVAIGGVEEDHAYVSDSFTLGAPGAPSGCDLDGDGSADNALGGLVVSLSMLFGASFDPDAAFAAVFAMGEDRLVWSIEGVASWERDPGLVVRGALARDADGDPANDFGGSGVFAVREDGLGSEMPGAICDATLVAGPALEGDGGELPLLIPLATGFPLARVTLRHTGIASGAGSDDAFDGVLCGALDEAEVRSALHPAAIDGLVLLIAADALDPATACVSDGSSTNGASADCAALGAGALCSASNGVDTGTCLSENGAGAYLLDEFDLDGDGVLSLAEMEPILSLVFAPDLDLDASAGECDQAPACGGVPDATSFALRFTAVRAEVDGF